MSEVKVNKISPRIDCGTVTVGDAGDSVTVTAGVPVTVNGDLKSNALKAVDGGSIISQCGTTITLGASGDTINLAAGASQTGFGRTGTVDWDTTAKTASFTAVSGNGYFVNTTSGAITVTLPAGSAGDIVSLADYAGTWQTNNVTVTPNGTDKIGGANANATLSTEGQSVTFVYADSTQGWLNTMDSTSNVRGQIPFIVASVSGAGNTLATAPDCSNMKIATFTGPGTFTVCAISNVCAARNKVDYMVVAGGGGGSGYTGAGGAGGFRESHAPAVSGPYTASPLATPTSLIVTATDFPIAVGGGGAGGAGGGLCKGVNGSNSSFSTITSAGGGGGGGYGATPSATGENGGSGGGGGHRAGAGAPFSGPGGSGNTPPVSPPQGQGGGNGADIDSPYTSRGGGGGGGAGGSGSNGSSNTGGNGGAGVATSITGSPVTRAGGGGGSGDFRCGTGTVGTGGSGGGTNGAPISTPASNAAANTGGGGGAGTLCTDGGAGGSGIVVIRYKFQ